MITIRNLSFQYKELETNALKNINLDIQDGEFVLLCGRSGCGKTTITRLINGLIPQFYPGKMEGKVFIDKQDIFEIPMYELAKKVGSVFQNPRSQFFNVDVDSEIAFGLENMGLARQLLKQRVQATIKDLQLENLSGKNLHDLSGGEKQKIAFASIYAINNDIYLLDEPSSNLDIQAIKSLHDYLKILKSKKKTIIIAEHRLYYLMDLVDKIVYIENGQIKNIYHPHELLNLSLQQREKMGLRTLCLQDVALNIKKTKPLNNDVLNVKNLSLFYKKQCVLKNISLKASQGEIIGIVGFNGTGKSTFLKALCGLHKNYTGSIYWNYQKINTKKCMKLSYMVMQDVNYELFAESVLEECCLGIKNPDKKTIEKTLTLLDLMQYKNYHPYTLSGGQKQRVAVAISMVCQKELLVFDEPTSGLDYDSMKRVSHLLKKLSALHKVIFVVSHDYEFLSQSCHRVICFHNGQLKHDFMMNEDAKELLYEIFKIRGSYDE